MPKPEAGLREGDLDFSAVRCSASMAERYLDETRHIDVSKLPADIHHSLRFHPHCVFGPGTHLPCLIALMRDPVTDEPVGIQRIALEHRDGRIEKVDRRMLGRAGVVKLWPAGSSWWSAKVSRPCSRRRRAFLTQDASLTPAWADALQQEAQDPTGDPRRSTARRLDRQRRQPGRSGGSSLSQERMARGRRAAADAADRRHRLQ